MFKRFSLVVSVLAVLVAMGLVVTYASFSQGSMERKKVVELMKAHAALSMGEHGRYHEMIMALSKKYPNDSQLKSLHEQVHNTMHQRMQMEEEILNSEFFNVTGG